MKKILFCAISVFYSFSSFGTTLSPVQLLNPVGSTSGQTVVSTGSSTAPGWANATVANITGAAPLASPTFTGTVTIPVNGVLTASPTAGDATGKIATTFYVQNALNGSQPAAFTALTASGNDALFYQTTNAQSFTSGTAATITTWTKVFDRLNTNFNASTGIFTAPITGIYHVAAQLDFSANTGAIATVGQVFIVANGTVVATGNFNRQTATSTVMPCAVTADVSLTAGQTIVIQGSQNTGGAVTLNGASIQNYLSIHRVP